MKKYRITKITVKTREIVSVSKNAIDENRFSVCPICQTTLNESFSTAERNVDETRNETQTLALLPNAFSKNDR